MRFSIKTSFCPQNPRFTRNPCRRLIGTPLALTPLVFSGVTAGEVYEAMRYKHEMTLTPNGGELGKKLLRVGHIGYHPHEDQEQLVLALKDVLNGGI